MLSTNRQHYIRFLDIRARRIWLIALLHGNKAVTQEMWQAAEEYKEALEDLPRSLGDSGNVASGRRIHHDRI